MKNRILHSESTESNGYAAHATLPDRAETPGSVSIFCALCRVEVVMIGWLRKKEFPRGSILVCSVPDSNALHDLPLVLVGSGRQN